MTLPLPTVQPGGRVLARWPIPRDNEILVVPLGGLGRIGMNWTFYGTAGRWIGVDAGIAFPGDGMEGVDAIIPHPDVIGPILDRLDALVVTHAHEDHIGAIDRLWPNVINCPIHASPYATEAISRRLDEAGALDAVDIRTFQVGASFEAGPFAIRTVRMTHSVPEPVALAITAAAGTVLHTGDWKIDPEPLIGLPCDMDAIREIGDAGLLAMVCDSTNATVEKGITSEAMVREAFRHVAKTCKGTVVFCCFATNVARMSSAAVACDEAGRKVALAGRSMRNNEAIADHLGLLEDVPRFLAEPSHLQGLEKSAVALVCTGTQGEERAALARLTRGDWRLPKLGHGDVVVTSARVIPGNEKSVEAVLSKLRAKGVKILASGDTAGGHPIHVSGHAGREELRMMHAAARPRFVIPVHGEAHHLSAHAELAAACGAEAAPVGTEGEVFSVSGSGIRSLGRLRTRNMHLVNDERGNRVPVAAPGERAPSPQTTARAPKA